MARSSELTTSFIAGLREIMRRGRSARNARNVLSACSDSETPWAAAVAAAAEAAQSKSIETHETRTYGEGRGVSFCDAGAGSGLPSLANNEEVQHVPAVAQVRSRIRDEEAGGEHLRDHLSRERDGECDVDGAKQLPQEARKRLTTKKAPRSTSRTKYSETCRGGSGRRGATSDGVVGEPMAVE